MAVVPNAIYTTKSREVNQSGRAKNFFHPRDFNFLYCGDLLYKNLLN